MTNFASRTTRKAQGGFTLLEMLVTVGIMAAVAGTATLALQDTTARASAAAHVAMMDELNEGIMTFRALPNNNNSYPNNFDSLLQTAATDATAAVAFEKLGVAVSNATDGVQDVTPFALDAAMVEALSGGGISELRYVSNALDADGTDSAFTCAAGQIGNLINSRANAVVPGNIFMSPDANGCGASVTLAAGDLVMAWSGGNERVLGSAAVDAEPAFTAAGGVDVAGSDTGAKVLMAVGAGPSSTLFDASELGGMSSVPVYRHVANDEYNRFIVLFHVASVVDDPANPGTNILVAADQVVIAGVVDGAGDTKEEELGEWDGTRNTI